MSPSDPPQDEERRATVSRSTAKASEAPLSHCASKRHAFLFVYHRDGVEVVPLSPGIGVVVGREPPADIAINDRCLSRRHARFTLIGADEVTVEDLGSTNGTPIAGARIERGTLRAGDEAQLDRISVTLQVLSGTEASRLGMEGHDAFRHALECEIARARYFHRSFAALVVRAAERSDGHPSRWSSRVRSLLRPIDRVALYSADAIEILLPEVDAEQALVTARTLVEHRPGEPLLLCGVALFPGAAIASTAASRTFSPHSRPAAAGLERDLVIESPAMCSLVETAMRLARSSMPVLLHGETGTGKEVLARLIHKAGPRHRKLLICVNCAAIPPTLVESTLFGHERGAFTSAVQQQGVFEAADGGTLFLDEIGDLAPPAQAALLRVLETKRLMRLGSTKEIDVDVRIIAATHRDLEAMCWRGDFRTDLYYRLSTMVVEIPPLRERREDIGPLAKRFAAQFSSASERPMRGFEPDALALLERYSWPGNVRELRNAIERAVFMAEDDVITVLDLPPRVRCGGAAAGGTSADSAYPIENLKDCMHRLEAEAILAALHETGWHQTEAARRLEIPLRTLQHKIKVHGIKRGGHAVRGSNPSPLDRQGRTQPRRLG